VIRLNNGTQIVVGDGWSVVKLPCGHEVHARPNERTPEMAKKLGYGEGEDAVKRLTEQHDPLHARLTDWLGMPFSYSLMQAAGDPVDQHIADLEEAAVLSVQELKAAWEATRA
jgi:hypothetical protein